MRIDTDWHVHTHNSCDGACMEFETFIRDAKDLGLRDFGVSDHLHSLIQEPDIAASRRDYDAAMERHPELKGHFHFGVEASVISEWELEKINRGEYTELPIYGIRFGGPENAAPALALNDEFLEKYKIEYVVTGVHWSFYCPETQQAMLKEYHRQYMFAATHPYTDIMAHYLWWQIRDTMDNPFIPFTVISETMKSELKAALRENQVAYELNLGAVIFSKDLPDSFKDEYLGWAADLQHSGVTLSIGTDCHSPSLKEIENMNGKIYEEAGKLLEHYKIDGNALFRL